MKSSVIWFLALGLLAGVGRAQIPVAAAERQSVKIFQTVTPVFPRELPELGFLRGEARVAIAIDETGKLTDWLVVGYSHRRFAAESVEAIKQWRFEPARVQGKPVSVQIELLINFETSGVVISCDVNTAMERYTNTLFQSREAYQPCTMKEIDRIPTPRNAMSPTYSKTLVQEGVHGTVVVDFFIDETGTVRMPAIQRSDYDELSSLAIAAIQQWKFDPPTRQGVPVLVRAKQVFHFGLKQS